jgi:hypothetical protein
MTSRVTRREAENEGMSDAVQGPAHTIATRASIVPPNGIDAHAARARLHGAHALPAANLCACALRKGHQGVKRPFGGKPAAVRLKHADVTCRQIKSRKSPHQLGGCEYLVLESVRMSAGEGSLDEIALRRADLNDPRAVEKPAPALLLQLPPERIGPAQKRDVRGMLEIAQPDDAGCAVR